MTVAGPPRGGDPRPAVPAMVDYAINLCDRQDTPYAPRQRMLPRFLLGQPKPSPSDFAGFDPADYLRQNPDVAAAGFSPLKHFATIGWLENRQLSDALDAKRYLAADARARRALLDIHAARHPTPAAGGRSAAARRPGVLLVGYVEAAIGLGESTRGLARALAHAGEPFGLYPYNLNVERRFERPFMPERYDKSGRYEATLFEANGDQLGDFLDQFAHRLEASHGIFRTYWELPEAPRDWAPDLAHFDEIWAPTTFVARAFRRVFDGTITIVPTCVSAGMSDTAGRAALGLPADPFLFVFTFDYNSIPERKNPIGLVEAFRAAFPKGDDGVGLVLKATGLPEHSPATRAALASAASRDPRIVVIDETLPRDRLLSLISACDCYVSLHRAEGFGLGMAEALALGRSVIATDWSGSADFLDEGTGYPVPYSLRPLREDEYPHAEGQSWAEPDLAAAAAIMCRVREDRAGREVRAAAGRDRIENSFGIETVGRIATTRLREVLRSRAGAAG